MQWSERVKNLRKSLRLSQRQMADLFSVAPGTISLWEKGQRSVPGPAQRLVEVLEYNHQLQLTHELESFASSPWKRFFGVAALAKGYGKNWVKDQVRPIFVGRDKALRLKTEAGHAMFREFVHVMSSLRGLQFKFVQMFATMRDDLPDDMRNYLANAELQPKPITPLEVIGVFKDDFNKLPEDLFDHWESLPFAIGSISQVHHARKGTDPLAVKVQYPGIVKALKSDLRNLEYFSLFLSKVAGFASPEPLVEEIQERLLDECDYQLERHSMQEFHEIYKDDEDILIPKVYPQFGSPQILTMEKVHGRDFWDLQKTGTQEERNHFAQLVFRFHFQSIYQHGIFNADPHPGNYLDCEGRLAVLDYGCVRHYSEETLNIYRQMFQSALANDLDTFRKVNIKAGNVENIEKFDFEYHLKCTVLLLEPVIAEDNTFTFNHHYVRSIFDVLVRENPNLRHAKIAKETVFLHRLQFGLYSMLADLNAQGPWQSLYRQTTGVIQDYKPLHSVLKQ